MHAAELDRGRDNKRAPRLGAFTAQRTRCIVKFVQRGAASLKVSRTLGRQPDRAGGAAQQHDPQAFFQIGDRPARRSGGDAQRARRLRETAAIGNSHKSLESVVPVHYPVYRTNEVRILPIIMCLESSDTLHDKRISHFVGTVPWTQNPRAMLAFTASVKAAQARRGSR